jgi:hypothetical protein
MLFSLAGLALVGGISMICFTKSFGTIFLGSPRTHLHQQPKEVTWNMRLPQYFILLIMVSIGLFPQYYVSLVNEIILNSFPLESADGLSMPVAVLKSISLIGRYAMLFIMIPAVIWFIKKQVSGKHSVVFNATWGCAYIAPNPKMQYTGKSFSKSLGKLLNFVVLEKKKYKEISANEIFPASRKHSSHYKDFFVIRIYDWITDRLLFSMNYFQFIQNGKLQMYILYGIFFIILVFLGTIFKII